MTCGESKQFMVDGWNGEAAPEAFTLHLRECGECRSEASQLGAMWERLGTLPVPEPGPGMRGRWASALESARRESFASRKPRFAWWPQQPAWQMALVACGVLAGVLLGFTGGSFWQRASAEHSEIATLRREVAGTREMVALSLLKENTASERLKGVDYSGRMSRLEPEVVQALLQAVSMDPNVNVRLAAIDALARAAGDSQVRQSLARSMPAQESPMVQAALIDYLVDAHDKNAAVPLRQLAARPELDPVVRQRANRALTVLSQ